MGPKGFKNNPKACVSILSDFKHVAILPLNFVQLEVSKTIELDILLRKNASQGGERS